MRAAVPVAAALALFACRDGGPPPVPAVDGPLELRVVHPAPGARVPPGGFDYVSGSTGTGRATLRIDGSPVPVLPNGAFLAYVRVPRGQPGYRLEAARGGDTARVLLPIGGDSGAAGNAGPGTGDAPGERGRQVVLASPDTAGLGDRSVLASDTPDGVRGWSLLPGSRAVVTGGAGDRLRVRLSPAVEVWVHRRDARFLPPGAPPPAKPRVGTAALAGAPRWVELAVATGTPPAVRTLASGDSLVLVVYDVGAPAGSGRLEGQDPWITSAAWTGTGDRVRYSIHLRGPVWGYELLWREGAVVLRIRRPPALSRSEPLRGLTLAIDLGHPPGGAVGPTGLEEASVTLAVGALVRRQLEERGARVVLTRSGPGPVSLPRRMAAARRHDAHAYVSIHVDAVPSGLDPSAMQGTSTYAFNESALPLARAVQWGMVGRLGLRDRGVRQGDYAVVRSTWMPAVLAEGATLTIPEHEAALRTPEFQRAYARGIVDGLELYFRRLAEHSSGAR